VKEAVNGTDAAFLSLLIPAAAMHLQNTLPLARWMRNQDDPSGNSTLLEQPQAMSLSRCKAVAL